MGTLCISGSALQKCGKNVSLSGSALIDSFILQAEGWVNSVTRKNWNDVYATLNTDVKYVLEEIVSNKAAMYAINYDMSGFTSREEAETMLDVLRDAITMSISELKDDKVKDFMVGA